MKKIRRFFFIILGFSLFFFLFSCNKSNSIPSDDDAIKNYSITWKNSNGELLATDAVKEGDVPAYNGKTPTKESDNTYDYIFDGWDKDVVAATENTIYTAVYKSEYINYTVKFLNYNDEELSSNTYHYGDTINYPETNPTRPNVGTTEFRFEGWNHNDTTCSGNMTFKAEYSSSEYALIKFVNYNGEELQSELVEVGTRPAYKGDTPTKQADNTYNYIFNDWDIEIVDVIEDTTYTATFRNEFINYTITFVNYNDDVIDSSTYHYNDDVVIPSNPSKPSDSTYNYIYDGWDKDVTKVLGNATYKATYRNEYINYTVRFINYNDTELSSNTYHYNDEVSVPSTPIKPSTNTYYYVFDGWDKEVTNVTGNATYKATYREEFIEYIISFVNYNTTVIKTTKYHYNDTIEYPTTTPTRPSDGDYNYKFNSWNSSKTKVDGDLMITAMYDAVPIDYIHKLTVYGIDSSETENDSGYNITELGTIYYRYNIENSGYYKDNECKNFTNIFEYSYTNFTILGLYKNNIVNNGHTNYTVDYNSILTDSNNQFIVTPNQRRFSDNSSIYLLAVPKQYTLSFEFNECIYGETSGSKPNNINYYYNEPLNTTIEMPTSTYYLPVYKKDNVIYIDTTGKSTSVPFKYQSTELEISWEVQVYDEIYISTFEGLQQVTDTDATFRLICDIDLGGEEIGSLGNFIGVLNGDNHYINNFNVKITNTGITYAGLFAINSGTINYLKIGDSNTDRLNTFNVTVAEQSKTYVYCGLLVGYNYGTINQCVIEGYLFDIIVNDINNDKASVLYLGGIAGYSAGLIADSTLRRCNINGTVNKTTDSGDDAYGELGGICGYSTANIERCKTDNTRLYIFVDGDGEWNNEAYPNIMLGGILGEQEGGQLIDNEVINVYEMRAKGGRGGYTAPIYYLGKVIGKKTSGDGETNTTIELTPTVKAYDTYSDTTWIKEFSDNIGSKYAPGTKHT